METLWQRLTHWAANCPLDIAFNPGADEGAIATAESALGLSFPADLRAYLTLADGEQWNSDGLIGGLSAPLCRRQRRAGAGRLSP